MVWRHYLCFVYQFCLKKERHALNPGASQISHDPLLIGGRLLIGKGCEREIDPFLNPVQS